MRYNKAYNQSDFNSKGNFTFNNLQDYMNNSAFNLTQALQTASWDAKQWQTYFYVQDDFRVTPDLTLNVGLRYELSDVPLGLFGATDPESLAVLVPPPPAEGHEQLGAAHRLQLVPAVLERHPRRRQDRLPRRLRHGLRRALLQPAHGQRLELPAHRHREHQQRPRHLPEPAPGRRQPRLQPARTRGPTRDANTENPDSKFWSFSSGASSASFVIEAGYTGSRGGNGINQVHANPSVLTAEQAALVAATKNANAIPSVQARRVYPQYGVRTLIPAYTGPAGNDVEARSEYNGVYVSVNKRFSHGLQFGVSYTRSKFESNNDASLGETGTDGSNQRPQSMFDYEAEWSLSQFDVPNRFVVNYTWEVPGPKSGFLKHILGGWQFSGITAFQSGPPLHDLDRRRLERRRDDRLRPAGPGSGSLNWDDEHRSFTNDGYVTVPLGTNNLPLANSLGDGNLPRNADRAASYWNTDLSLLKRIYIGQRQLVLRADAFNAFNQDNYGIPVVNMANSGFGTNTNGLGPAHRHDQREVHLVARERLA